MSSLITNLLGVHGASCNWIVFVEAEKVAEVAKIQFTQKVSVVKEFSMHCDNRMMTGKRMTIHYLFRSFSFPSCGCWNIVPPLFLKVMEKEKQKEMSRIEDETSLARITGRADADYYTAQKESAANTVRTNILVTNSKKTLD